ncbi:tape measure protein [Latilactobacillus curvatus]|uniref:tape measure protein n=1 Tax=Latilactobacillus curvatus TaxID=28038 RepID=UPI00217DBFA5|nr:tape measure protein [Latilactobacillus curvatus]MCS6143435.1 tape measure protein [Latilactobacillus curvatus]
MAKKVSAVMATQVALDTLSSVNSLKDLTSAVKVATGAWKSQETLLKSTGDYLKASEARYNGLGEAISRQKDKVEALKAKQSGLNVETKEGAQAYLKYQQDLDRATTQLNSMNAQQQKAKQSMDLQKTGVIGLNQEIRNGESVTKSFVERLKAEGRESDALKAKQSGLRDSLSKQQELYKKQEDILKQIADKSGKVSDEYQRQQVRVNELGTKIAGTKNEMQELNGQLSKKPSFSFAGIKSHLDSVNEKAAKTSSLFGKLVGAQIIGNGITSGLQFLQSHFTGLIKSGVDYNKELENITIGMTNFTGSSEAAEPLVKTFESLKEKSGYAAGTISLLTKKSYGLTKNVDGTNKLGEAFVNLGRATGQSDEKLQGIITKFSQANASGQITTGSLTKLEKSLPGFNAALSTSMGKSRDDINQLASDGKLSMGNLQDAIIAMSDSKKNGLDNYFKTYDGFASHFEERYKHLSGEITSGFFNKNNNVLSTLSKSLDGQQIEESFGRVGGAVSTAINTVSDGFKKVFSFQNGQQMLVKMVDGLANGITKAGDSVAKHAPDIVSFFKATKEAGGTSFTIFVQTLKDLEPVLKIVGGYAKSNPKLFAEMAAGMLIANKATQGLNLAFGSLASVFRLSSGVFNTIKFPFSQFKKMGVEGTKANKIISGMKTTFSTMGSVFKSVGSGISAAAKFAFKSVADQAKLMGKGLAAVGKAGGKALKFTAKLGWSAVKSGSKLLGKSLVATGKAGLKALKFTAKISVKAAQLALKGLLKSAKLTGAGLKAAFNFAKANPLIAIATAIAAVVTGLIVLYKHNKKFRDFVNGIVKSATKMAKDVTKWFTNLWKDSVKIFNSMFKFIKPIFSNGFDVINSYGRVFKDLFSGNWKNLDKDVRGVINSLIKFWKSAFTGAFNVVNKLTGGRLGDMVNTFKGYFGQLSGIVSGAADGVRKGAVSIARGVITPINKMLEGLKSGLNWVLSKVGASEIKASWSIPLPAYARGTRGAHPGGLALVNDSPTAKYREMYHLPNGQFGMFPKKRNMIVPLPKGTEVLDGDSSHELASMMGLPMYKNGIGSFFSGMWDKAKDIAEEAENIIAHPIKFMESVFTKFVGNFGKGFAGDVVTSFPKTIANSAANWVKKLFDDIGGSSAPAGSGVQRWKSQVIKALKANGLSASAAMVNKVLRQINTESGGNEKAIGGTDGLADGRAMGLMQVKPGTFNANKFPGHGNIMNGYDSLLAGLNYAKKRYGSDLSFLGKGHGYENGGMISQHGLYEIAERNKPEMVIPLDTMKRSRGWQLIGEVINRFIGDDPSIMGKKSITQDDKGNEELKQLNAKFDMLLQMFSKLLGLTTEQIEAIKAGAFNKNEQYKQQALDQILRDAQSM